MSDLGMENHWKGNKFYVEDKDTELKFLREGVPGALDVRKGLFKQLVVHSNLQTVALERKIERAKCLLIEGGEGTHASDLLTHAVLYARSHNLFELSIFIPDASIFVDGSYPLQENCMGSSFDQPKLVMKILKDLFYTQGRALREFEAPIVVETSFRRYVEAAASKYKMTPYGAVGTSRLIDYVRYGMNTPVVATLAFKSLLDSIKILRIRTLLAIHNVQYLYGNSKYRDSEGDAEVTPPLVADKDGAVPITPGLVGKKVAGYVPAGRLPIVEYLREHSSEVTRSANFVPVLTSSTATIVESRPVENQAASLAPDTLVAGCVDLRYYVDLIETANELNVFGVPVQALPLAAALISLVGPVEADFLRLLSTEQNASNVFAFLGRPPAQCLIGSRTAGDNEELMKKLGLFGPETELSRAVGAIVNSYRYKFEDLAFADSHGSKFQDFMVDVQQNAGRIWPYSRDEVERDFPKSADVFPDSRLAELERQTPYAKETIGALLALAVRPGKQLKPTPLSVLSAGLHETRFTVFKSGFEEKKVIDPIALDMGIPQEYHKEMHDRIKRHQNITARKPEKFFDEQHPEVEYSKEVMPWIGAQEMIPSPLVLSGLLAALIPDSLLLGQKHVTAFPLSIPKLQVIRVLASKHEHFIKMTGISNPFRFTNEDRRKRAELENSPEAEKRTLRLLPTFIHPWPILPNRGFASLPAQRVEDSWFRMVPYCLYVFPGGDLVSGQRKTDVGFVMLQEKNVWQTEATRARMQGVSAQIKDAMIAGGGSGDNAKDAGDFPSEAERKRSIYLRQNFPDLLTEEKVRKFELLVFVWNHLSRLEASPTDLVDFLEVCPSPTLNDEAEASEPGPKLMLDYLCHYAFDACSVLRSPLLAGAEDVYAENAAQQFDRESVTYAFCKAQQSVRLFCLTSVTNQRSDRSWWGPLRVGEGFVGDSNVLLTEITPNNVIKT